MKHRILITNDDSIHAEGIAVLERIARLISDDVWVVAPEYDQSGMSHSLSMLGPVRVRQAGEKKYAVCGTPVDCIVIACRHLLREQPPTLILSGINHGANLAEDLNYSGTIAAAMEGAIQGIRSIALSQVTEKNRLRWDTVEHHALDVLQRVLDLDLEPGVFLNVNFPAVAPAAVTGVAMTRAGQRTVFNLEANPQRDARGFPFYWISFHHTAKDPANGTDLHAIQQRMISVTPLHPDLTHVSTSESLELPEFPQALSA